MNDYDYAEHASNAVLSVDRLPYTDVVVADLPSDLLMVALGHTAIRLCLDSKTSADWPLQGHVSGIAAAVRFPARMYK
jgi:hypothetical protein